jgi:hypothetical protein
MGMVPTGPVEICKECVCEASSGGDWALLDAWNAIHPPLRVIIGSGKVGPVSLTVKFSAEFRANAELCLPAARQYYCER